MADAAAARREARRKKILENSHNRLQLISGKNVNESCKESPIRAPISEPTADIPITEESSSSHKCGLNNGVINTAEPFGYMTTNHEDLAFGDGNVTSLSHDLAAFISPPTPEPTQTPSLIDILVSYKYDIVLLSLLIQLLYSFSLINFTNTYFFLPLVIYVTTKLIWFPKQHSSNFANVLLMLNGMSASRIQRIMSIVQWVSAFSQDMCVFLFTTICAQSVLQYIGSNIL